MSKENVEVIRKLVEALRLSGIEGIREYFDPNVEWVTDPRLSGSGKVYTEIGTVIAYLAGLYARLKGHIHFDVKRIESIDDQNVLVETTASTQTRWSEGRVELSDWFFIATLLNGKVSRVRSFVRTEEVLKAAGLSE